MRYIVTVLSVLFYCNFAAAQTTPKPQEQQPPPPTAQEIQQAYGQIKSAPYLAIGNVGFAGTISDAEKGIEILVRAKEVRLLEALFREKNPVARLYALRGMRGLNHPQARLFATSLQQSDVRVPVMRGCLLSYKTLSSLAGQGPVFVEEDSLTATPAAVKPAGKGVQKTQP